MKQWLRVLIIMLISSLSLAHGDIYDDAIKSPTSFFRTIAKVMLQTQISYPEDPGSEAVILEGNVQKVLQVHSALGIQKKLNTRFGNLVADILAEDSVLNGHELHLLGKILGASHALSARALEYSSLYNLEQQAGNPRIVVNGNIQQTKKNLIWLSTHVGLFDLYRDGYLHFYREGRIRRVVKNIIKADSRKDNKLRELGTMIAHTTSKENRYLLRSFLRLYELDKKTLNEMGKRDPQIKTLTLIIDSTPIKEGLLSTESLKFKSYSFIDGFLSFLDKSMNIVSAFFGNSVGAVRWRKGYLNSHKPTHARLKESLRPLDIIFEKTPFALTDTFIPGNFGHAAIYIGTEDQLKKIGMWNHPDVIPHHENLKKGHVIVEALRPGVRTASIKEWMNIDEIFVLRHPSILTDDTSEVHRMYTRIMKQIGKKYDFNFDVTTTDKVVCSELVFHAFGKINWPTKYIMGRATISPDDVAQVVLYRGNPLQFNAYIFSNSKNTVRDLDIYDLAKKLGFIHNKERSTLEEPSFDRAVRKCRKVRRTGLRQGSYRHKHRLITVCKTEYKELDYSELERSYTIEKRHAKDGNH